MYQRKGQLFVVSAPSGAGKTTLCNMLLNEFPRLKYSVSYTTRAPRANEVNGVHYHYVGKDLFTKMIENGDFLEYANVHNNYYGTSKLALETSLHEGNDILMDIDPQGAMQLKNRLPYGVFIFIMPPSIGELRNRLTSRNDTIDSLELRMQNAVTEMGYMPKYDYVVVNDELSSAYKIVSSIYVAEINKINLIV